MRFDAYTATTTTATPSEVLAASAGVFGLFADMQMKQGKGQHQFGEKLAITDDGREVMAVQWGGSHGDRVMVEVKGERTPAAVEAFRAAFRHRVTRVDACADFDAPGVFDELYKNCVKVKRANRLKGSKHGDWDDYPEDGRTLYLGSPNSAVRARLYEKGKQPGYVHLGRSDWVRLEVQARPASPEQKEQFAHLAPLDVWGASKWTRDLAAAVLREYVDPHPAGSIYRLSQRDTALAWMCKQYGAHLVSLCNDLGGWDCVGLTLAEIIAEQKKGH